MPAADSPRVPSSTRLSLAPEAVTELLPRQLAWAGTSATAGLAFSTTTWGQTHPDAVLALAMGLGLFAAFPHLRAALGALLLSGGTLLAGLGGATTLGSWTSQLSTDITGLQVLAAGALAGVLICWLDEQAFTGLRALHTALATTAMAGLGWWVATRLAPGVSAPWLATGARLGLLGLIVSQGTLAAAVRLESAARIPSPTRIKATLRAPYREVCLRAWQLDRDLAAQAPDPETRDELGEVAAWVYKLQWTLAQMDANSDDRDDLPERIVALTEAALASEDPFTRERKLAAATHLEQLQAHHRALATERTRTEALSDYAAAFLEEARASLILARIQPGEHTPARLGDVLSRLRTYATERGVQRQTAHEVAALA